MLNKNPEIIYVKNDPITNRLTAPANKLVRPKINYIKAIILMILILTISVIISFITTPLIVESNYFSLFNNLSLNSQIISMSFLGFFIISLLIMKYYLIFFIRIYQKYALPEIRLRCCSEPSCSEYGILALKKYGVIIGVFKTVKRLKRCACPGEVDYP